MESFNSENIKKMADALRAGAKMLPDICPICKSPLFEIKGEIRCIKCDKKVIKVKDESEATTYTIPYVLRNLDLTLIQKIEELTLKLSKTFDLNEIKNTGEILNILLNVLRESKKLQEEKISEE
ncbi:MAG: Sjogren's syndrome/scleroderma autoantigen 1 family protein [Nitrososphaerota archaeon]